MRRRCLTPGEIVADYMDDYWVAARNRDEKWWKAQGESNTDAIRRAAFSNIDNAKHNHQWRIADAVLFACAKALVAIESELVACTDFDRLFTLVEKTLTQIRGAGELVVYDVTDRIAIRLGLDPEYIYLHAGTRAGALALFGRGALIGKGKIRVSEINLPAPFATLAPRALEDILCTYKPDFAGDTEASVRRQEQRARRIGCGGSRAIC